MTILLLLLGLAQLEDPPAAFVAAADYSESQEGLALVVRDASGAIVFERFAEGYSPDNPLPLWTGAHGLWTLAALAAEEDGLLELDAPVARFLPAWHDIPSKSRVLVSQLLDMSAGLDPSPKAIRSVYTADRYQAAVDSRMTELAGSKFHFGPSTWLVFGAVLREVGKPQGEDAFAYLQRRILDPLGIEPPPWERDDAGNPMIPFGAYLNARDWSKVGALVVAGGRVGETQVIGSERIARLSRPCPANEGYGLGFWRRSSLKADPGEVAEGEDPLAGLPDDILFSAGTGNLRLYVIPSRGLSVARLAFEKRSWSDESFLRLLLDVPDPAPATDGDDE